MCAQCLEPFAGMQIYGRANCLLLHESLPSTVRLSISMLSSLLSQIASLFGGKCVDASVLEIDKFTCASVMPHDWRSLHPVSLHS